MFIVVYDEGLASKFLARLLSGLHELKVNVKGYEFSVEKLGFELINPFQILSSGEFLKEVDIEFVTPTYFNPMHGDARYKVLYPDLTLMFASLISTAYQLTGVSYPKPEDVADLTYISGLDIKTPFIRDMQHEAPTGFVEWVKLRTKEGIDEKASRMIAGLLKLGEITNVGGNRSGGYGVMKLKTPQDKDVAVTHSVAETPQPRSG
ncbi:MAG: CRISPR system precrRNA processing endoribonuclease RAMP protein Cas6 [Zestosphaera sp.]